MNNIESSIENNIERNQKNLLVGHGVKVGAVLSTTLLLAGCWQTVKVERWTDLERPCQPHGFYIAPKGDSLADVAKTCKTDDLLLSRYNAWLLTRQPFAEPTVVWLKQNPNVRPEDEILSIDVITPVTNRMMSSESLH